MATKTKFTKEQEDYFFVMIDLYQEKLNLLDWHIGRTKKRPSTVMAEVEIHWEDKIARVSLGSDWGRTEVNNENLEAIAFHEMLHVFLKPLIEAAATNNTTATAAAEHSIIAVLEKFIHKRISK